MAKHFFVNIFFVKSNDYHLFYYLYTKIIRL